jgi:hypothetical protein
MATQNSLVARLVGGSPSESSVASVRGDTVLPLSELAAQSENERAENFAFTSDDEVLLKHVLASSDGAGSNGQHGGHSETPGTAP